MTDFSQSLELRSGLVLQNRLVMAPMTIVSSFDNGLVSAEEVQHYADRSAGLGAVITAAANVTENGKGWRGQLKVSDDEAIQGLSGIAKAIQSKGAKAILQIFHAGRMASSEIIGEQPVSASFVRLEAEAEQPRELKEEEILEIIEAFGQATRRAIEAGFDGVEIHGANKYLIQQFFSRHSNIRIDHWGKELEKRMNFPLAVIDRVLAEVQKSATKAFAVGYRFSPIEMMTPGIRIDETLEFLEVLKTKDLDYLHVSLRTYSDLSNSQDFQEKTLLAYVHDALKGSNIPLIGVGAVRTREDVENVLQHAELCAIGQQLLVDPEFPVKLLENRDGEFVTKDFGEAINDLPMPNPMYNYLKKRYG